jgi:hypothetical protein
MNGDPILLRAGEALGVAGGLLLLTTVVAFFARWGVRFRLVGVTSFTLLLAISCAAFAFRWCSTTATAWWWLRRRLIWLPKPSVPRWSRWPATCVAPAGAGMAAWCGSACGVWSRPLPAPPNP